MFVRAPQNNKGHTQYWEEDGREASWLQCDLEKKINILFLVYTNMRTCPSMSQILLKPSAPFVFQYNSNST